MPTGACQHKCTCANMHARMHVSASLFHRLRGQVQAELGWTAVPARFISLPALPRTHSGKYMRSLLRKALILVDAAAAASSLTMDLTVASVVGGGGSGDLSNDVVGLANPECLPALLAALRLERRTRDEGLPSLDESRLDRGLQPEAARRLLRAIWRRVLRLPSVDSASSSTHMNLPMTDAALDVTTDAVLDVTPFGALGGASLAATQALALAARQGLQLPCDAPQLERLSIEQLVHSAGVHAGAPTGAHTRSAPPAEPDANAASDARAKSDANACAAAAALAPIRVGRYHVAAVGAAPSRLVILERDRRQPSAMPRDVGGISACAAGDLPQAQKLHAAGWDAAHAVDKFGSTALMWAASFGRVDVARWLVDEIGVAVDAQNKQGRTALMFATKYKQYAMAAYLINEAHADVKLRMRDESTAFDWAVFGGHQPTMALLADHPDVDINAVNRFGCAAVQWAAASGSVETCRWLHARGVNLAHVNDAHHGAVEKAAYRGHEELLQWLLLADDGPQLLPQLGLRDKDGRSLSDLVRMGGHENLACWLEPLVDAQLHILE